VVVFAKKHIFVVFAVFCCAFTLASTAGARDRAAHRSAATSLLLAVNRARVAHGLRPLRIDTTLARAARSHSDDMLRGNYFAHGDFHGRMVSFHVRGPVAGENLAWGNGPYARASTIIAEWLASPEHRANLLHAGWTRIGIGITSGTFLGNAGASVVTADFAGS
jgi:uncharacterized protein YkwD